MVIRVGKKYFLAKLSQLGSFATNFDDKNQEKVQCFIWDQTRPLGPLGPGTKLGPLGPSGPVRAPPHGH